MAQADPLRTAVVEYLDYLRVERGLAKNTLMAYARDLSRYEEYLRRKRVNSPDEITAGHIRGFAESLFESDLAPPSIARCLSALRSFHKFMLRESHLEDDVTQGVDSPRLGQPLPKAFDREAMRRLIESVTGGDAVSLRDRALMEVLYASGARISEIALLDIGDCDLDDGSLMVKGKGGKERYVPIGRPALEALIRYMELGRPELLMHNRSFRAETAVFLNARGSRLTRQGLWKIIKARGNKVGLGESLSPHVFRHSCATHLLEGGADIRAVQEILGHASLSTTQIYTRVTTDHMHDVYLQSHPRARSITRP